MTWPEYGTDPMSNRTERDRHDGHGISLYTMLAAVVVLGVLGSVVVTQYNGTGSRVTAATALVRNTVQAARRFHLDTGCYATNVTALMSHEAVSTNNTCERSISASRWHGPYIRPARTVPRSQGDADSTSDYPTLALPDLGPTAKLAVYNSGGNQQTVWVGNLPREVYKQIGPNFSNPWNKNDGDRAIMQRYVDR